MTPVERFSSRYKAVFLGIIGLFTLLAGIGSFIVQWRTSAPDINLHGKPALLFFSVDEACECIRKVVRSAEFQIANWSMEERYGVEILRINLDTQDNLADYYQIRHAPALLLLNKDGKVIYRQDYPVMENGPFLLAAFEEQLALLAEQSH